MKKRMFAAVAGLVLALAVAGCGDSRPQETVQAETTAPDYEIVVQTVTLRERAVWQDPGNVVLMWEADPNYTYRILRSDSPDGEFVSIGSSDTGSFRDDTAEHPNTYYYQIEGTHALEPKIGITEPVQPVVDPDAVTGVSVIMYHNFISYADEMKGVEYEEYSITPTAFERDLSWLKYNGYVTITSEELIWYLENKEPLPEKAVILSIDDGTRGVYTNAWPLLQKYGMKADLNIIGAWIDETWNLLDAGGTRDGQAAPYCTWEELVEMQESGVINLCSHTYDLHVFDEDGRIGMSLMENESEDSFVQAVSRDYELSVSCIEGWTGKSPRTVAYPYSRRSTESDRLVLENTGYEILMAGRGDRGTEGNYFVTGCDISAQLRLMSRPCRMDGTYIWTYLEDIEKVDQANGVNGPVS